MELPHPFFLHRVNMIFKSEKNRYNTKAVQILTCVHSFIIFITLTLDVTTMKCSSLQATLSLLHTSSLRGVGPKERNTFIKLLSRDYTLLELTWDTLSFSVDISPRHIAFLHSLLFQYKKMLLTTAAIPAILFFFGEFSSIRIPLFILLLFLPWSPSSSANSLFL